MAAEGNPILLEDSVFDLTHETSPYLHYPPHSFLHPLLLPHSLSPHSGLRHKRFVITHSMVNESRLNTALLVIFIICIFAINAFFFGIIMFSKRMRCSSKHLLIASVCFADLLQGLLCLPLIAGIGNDFECSKFQVARLLADYLIPSITTLGVLALNINYVLKLSCEAYAEGKSRAFILVALLVTPWLLSILLLVPIYAVGVDRTPYFVRASSCRIIMEGGYARALLILSYIIYGCILLVFTLVVAVMYLIKREYLGLDVTGERVHAPFDICLASFIVVLFYTPIFLFAVLTTEGYMGCEDKSECEALRWSFVLSLWLMFTKSWVMPMAWFFGKDTRAGIKEVLC